MRALADLVARWRTPEPRIPAERTEEQACVLCGTADTRHAGLPIAWGLRPVRLPPRDQRLDAHPAAGRSRHLPRVARLDDIGRSALLPGWGHVPAAAAGGVPSHGAAGGGDHGNLRSARTLGDAHRAGLRLPRGQHGRGGRGARGAGIRGCDAAQVAGCVDDLLQRDAGLGRCAGADADGEDGRGGRATPDRRAAAHRRVVEPEHGGGVRLLRESGRRADRRAGRADGLHVAAGPATRRGTAARRGGPLGRVAPGARADRPSGGAGAAA